MTVFPWHKNNCIELNENSFVCIYNSEEYLRNENIGELLSKLPDDEQEKYHRYRKQTDREMFLCSRIVLRTEVKKRFKCNFDFKLNYNENGKPFLQDQPGFHFNISHSAGLVIIGFSNHPIGVDIEKIVPYKKMELLKYAKTVFNEEEIAFLQKLSEKDAQYFFTKIWTMKESVIKNLGSGFTYNTKYIIFDSEGLINRNSTSNQFKNIEILSFDYNNEFIISNALNII